MELEEALRTYLLTKTGLTALIGTRIAPDDIADGMAIPCVTYKKISDVKTTTHQGISELEMPSFQFSCYADSKSVARRINNQIRTALTDYRGVMSGLTVQAITLLNEMSSRQNLGDGTGKYFIDSLEFEIAFRR